MKFTKAAALALALQLIASGWIYPSTLVVTKVSRKPGDMYMKVETCTGLSYKVKGDPEDFQVGDMCSAIMFSKGTKTCKDDKVLKLYYTSFRCDRRG